MPTVSAEKVENVVRPPRNPVTVINRTQAGHSGWKATSANTTPIECKRSINHALERSA